MSIRIHIENCDDSFPCPDGSNVLRAMECLGRRGIPVGCRGGGCGVCKVKVLDGRYRNEAISRACVSTEEEAEGYSLACKLIPESDLSLRVIGKMARSFDISRGAFHFYGAPATAPHRS
ncbi:2Fe-2S iron-sulfur cluster-binding protein [Nevskia sp.]|uniref:2Fe-2S iron-sulfur cluster-binding protein n=2 Tax=Nevskia sp. TaxID=1929292 RepID=UPI003F6F6378